jgi:hypothetical protein
MRKPKCIRLLVLLTGLLGAMAYLGWWCLAPPSHQITRERISQLQRGMSQAEVEALLGVPPGNYCSTRNVELIYPRRWPLVDVPCRGEKWISDEAGVTVYFDDAGTVVYEQVIFVVIRRRSLLDRLRDSLGW